MQEGMLCFSVFAEKMGFMLRQVETQSVVSVTGQGGCDKQQACTESFYSYMYGHCAEFMPFFQSKMVFLRPQQKCLFMQGKTNGDVRVTGAMLSCSCL